ncbi:MAG: hypothetical protein AAGF11_38795 [Myxococcota bacterium]
MSDVHQARRSARGDRSRRGRLAPLVVLALAGGEACSESSLDEAVPSASPSSSSEGGTLPAMDTSSPTTAALDEESGEPPPSDDPRLCIDPCRLTLPVDWIYEGTPPPPPEEGQGNEPPNDDPVPPLGSEFDPEGHLVPAMLRDPSDGSLILGEERRGTASLHRLDRHGRLQWNVPLPLPCDVCELTDITRHPSGDLLLSASGLLLDQGHGLIAARYDPIDHTVVWATTTPFPTPSFVTGRSGEIAALSNGAVAQLYLAGIGFSASQQILLASYDTEGSLLEQVILLQDQAMEIRYPLIARTLVGGDLLVSVPWGSSEIAFGRTAHLAPPLWNLALELFHPAPLDDAQPDARGHTIELGHAFDGTHTHLVLADREGLEPEPRWVATLALDSTTGRRAALALGPDAEPYAAARTTPALGEQAGPLVGLSLARWTTNGELRWHTTLLDRLDDSENPVEIVIDDDEGIIFATVIDDRLRVERRTQRCTCE